MTTSRVDSLTKLITLLNKLREDEEVIFRVLIVMRTDRYIVSH